MPLRTAVWHTRTGDTIASPFDVGELVYVKESWQTGISLNDKTPAQIATASVDAGYSTPWAPINFVAGGGKLNAQLLRDFGENWGRVRSPIHMPKWVSRITLQITQVRAQRLHEISEDDAIAEAVDGPHFGRWTDMEGNLTPPMSEPPRPWAHSYFVAWQAINERRAPWTDNPFVFVYTFSVKEKR